jgi:hypothetical protein
MFNRSLVLSLALLATLSLVGCGSDTLLSPTGHDSSVSVEGDSRAFEEPKEKEDSGEKDVIGSLSSMSMDQLAAAAQCIGEPAPQPPAIYPAPDAPLSAWVEFTRVMFAWRTEFLNYLAALPLGELVEMTPCLMGSGTDKA